MHRRTAERIVLTADLSSNDVVLEIGPGTGMLTRELLLRAGKVIAIETDVRLFEKLQSDFAADIASGHLDLHHADIRNLDSKLLPEKYMVVANIPYYITGEIIRMFLENAHQPSSMTLLVQKEVAERIARSKKESLLSLSVKVYGVPKYEFTVPKGAFSPAPKVDSAVLSIRNISRTNFENEEKEKCFFEIIRAGFAHKRKFLRNNLKGLVSAEKIAEKARAENLKLSDWLNLSK